MVMGLLELSVLLSIQNGNCGIEESCLPLEPSSPEFESQLYYLLLVQP